MVSPFSMSTMADGTSCLSLIKYSTLRSNGFSAVGLKLPFTISGFSFVSAHSAETANAKEANTVDNFIMKDDYVFYVFRREKIAIEASTRKSSFAKLASISCPMSFEHAMSVLNLDPVPSVEPETLQTMALDQLAQLRGRIESQIDALLSRLRAQKADMDTPLVTPDGFPRTDMDVVEVRLVCSQIIRLRNDWRAISSLLQTKLAESFNSTNTSSPPSRIPFATVDLVAEESPAQLAGLAVGDKLVSFGRVNATNHNNLKALVSAVAENVPVDLTLLRNNTLHTIKLVPSKWNGQGLLGCKFTVIA
ncbi:hypothetical protein OGAPHI_001101 [Ogataea philodendri]|uniref:Probable 26S proteasome regulatory subunit p27 n=1 Tax=Ogataea philodendri TaxID=1378263 RepID=A0A9P8PEU2_9ASCO|nr:uncharacterized protein OGAPHI_001101 [Ogataea philodendri]KAH3670586.1 hypothetical protein OGAPHI_001101 [Ogataea philodendri]